MQEANEIHEMSLKLDEMLQKLLLDDIYNADETSLFYGSHYTVHCVINILHFHAQKSQ